MQDLPAGNGGYFFIGGKFAVVQNGKFICGKFIGGKFIGGKFAVVQNGKFICGKFMNGKYTRKICHCSKQKNLSSANGILFSC